MLIGTISIKNLKEVIDSINYFVKNEINIISTKRIREFNKIDASNRSKVNFYSRILKELEKLGYLELYQIKPIKTYEVPETKLNLEQILKKLRSNHNGRK